MSVFVGATTGQGFDTLSPNARGSKYDRLP